MIKYDAGLFDGEGSFIITAYRRKNWRTGFSIWPSISLTINAYKGKAILEKLQEKFGGHIHSIYIDKGHLGKLPLVEWTLSSLDECERFAKTIQPHLIIKFDDCVVFRKIVKLVKAKRHYTKEGLLEILKLRENLNLYKRSRFWTFKRVKNELIV